MQGAYCYIKTLVRKTVSDKDGCSYKHESYVVCRFVQYVDEVLYKNARETQVGGVPSPVLRIKAFMDYVFRKNSGWTDSRFEV